MLSWKDDYCLGVPHIDEQHERLFEIAGRIYQLLKNEFCYDKYDKVLELIAELKEYTVFHFKSEEEYMKNAGYKNYFTHKLEHDDFVRNFNEVDFNVIDEDQDAYILEILEFVVKWIDEHILGKDKQIVLNI